MGFTPVSVGSIAAFGLFGESFKQISKLVPIVQRKAYSWVRILLPPCTVYSVCAFLAQQRWHHHVS